MDFEPLNQLSNVKQATFNDMLPMYVLFLISSLEASSMCPFYSTFGGTTGISKNMFVLTLLGINISHQKSLLKMVFLFPRWDMLVPWRVLHLTSTYFTRTYFSWKFFSTAGASPTQRRKRSDHVDPPHLHLLALSYHQRKAGLGCFQKEGYPQIIHFNRVFHYKPSILGYPYFWKPPLQEAESSIFLQPTPPPPEIHPY